MWWDLKNKVAVITGGAHGIGYNIADKYLHEEAKLVVIIDINEKYGLEAAQKLNLKYGVNKAVFLKCDITTDVETVVEQILSTYTVDILVNSAGIINELVPKKAIDVNLTGTINCSFKLWQHMRKDKGGNGGSIINISSICGYRNGPLFPTYQASKSGVIAFTKSLGHIINYERSGVRIIALCPGQTPTGIPIDLMVWDNALNDEIEKFSKTLLEQKVDDVGNAAVEIYLKAKSGTVWLIEGAKPVVEITV